MVYQSKQNPLIKKIYSLKDKKGRKEFSLYIVEGVKMVLEAISNRQEIENIVLEEGFSIDLNGYEDKIITVSKSVFSYLSCEKTPQGVLATLKINVKDVKPPRQNALLLDGVSDPGNLGTIIRTAAASGYLDIYAVNCVDAFSPKTVRSSMSGIYFVNFYKCTYEQAFSALCGVDLIVGDLQGENLFEFKPKRNYCIAVGNEGNGLSSEVKNLANYTLTIPMSENSESLNVAVAASIMMYELKY